MCVYIENKIGPKTMHCGTSRSRFTIGAYNYIFMLMEYIILYK